MGFECMDVGDQEKVKFRGLIVALEGGLNGQPEGTLFNLENWLQKKMIT
jgi:hypothetical protein